MSELGEAVRRARRDSGLSQRSLARRAGTTQAAISRIERDLEEPSFERFTAIMASMGWRPTVDLQPIASHREEPRRLLEEVRYGNPAARLESSINFARFASKLRRAVERTG